MPKFNRPAFLGALALTAGVGLVAVAGDLNPPAGPVAPTMKDLEDVEPRTVIRNNDDGSTPITIVGPGSYKLGENINAVDSGFAIEISGSRVTLDLNGFTVSGSELGTVNGIQLSPGANDITIRNGRVQLFNGVGVSGSSSERCRVEDVDFNNCFGGAVTLGDTAVVRNCTAENVTVAASIAFNVREGSIIEDCIARDCYNGFRLEGPAQVNDCIARDSVNAGFLLVGNVILDRCVAEGDTITAMTQYGIYHENQGNQDGCRITNSHIKHFIDAGIRIGRESLIRDNTVTGRAGVSITAIQSAGASNQIYQNLTRNCTNIFDLGGFCEQEVFLNRSSNYSNYSINDCADVAPIQNLATATNPFANR